MLLPQDGWPDARLTLDPDPARGAARRGAARRGAAAALTRPSGEGGASLSRASGMDGGEGGEGRARAPEAAMCVKVSRVRTFEPSASHYPLAQPRKKV